MYIVNYVNGTRVSAPFESPLIWPMSLAWVAGLVLFNIPVIWMLRKSELLIAYFACSMWLWATTPVNLPILWLIVLAYYPVKHGWLFLPVAVLAKLPLGSELFHGMAVWNYALHSGSALGHWFPYTLLGVWFVMLSLYHVDRRLHNGSLQWFLWLHLDSRMLD